MKKKKKKKKKYKIFFFLQLLFIVWLVAGQKYLSMCSKTIAYDENSNIMMWAP